MVPSLTAWQKSWSSLREWFGGVDAGRDDVAGSVGEAVFAERLGVFEGDAGVEETDGFGAGVVVDDHFSGADDGGAAQFAGGEPGELDVGDRSAREFEVDEGDVGDRGDDAAAAERADGGGGLVEPVAEDREVVWCEVPGDADVFLVEAEVDPACGDEVEVAQLSGLDQVADGDDGGL